MTQPAYITSAHEYYDPRIKLYGTSIAETGLDLNHRNKILDAVVMVDPSEAGIRTVPIQEVGIEKLFTALSGSRAKYCAVALAPWSRPLTSVNTQIALEQLAREGSTSILHLPAQVPYAQNALSSIFGNDGLPLTSLQALPASLATNRSHDSNTAKARTTFGDRVTMLLVPSSLLNRAIQIIYGIESMASRVYQLRFSRGPWYILPGKYLAPEKRSLISSFGFYYLDVPVMRNEVGAGAVPSNWQRHSLTHELRSVNNISMEVGSLEHGPLRGAVVAKVLSVTTRRNVTELLGQACAGRFFHDPYKIAMWNYHVQSTLKPVESNHIVGSSVYGSTEYRGGRADDVNFYSEYRLIDNQAMPVGS